MNKIIKQISSEAKVVDGEKYAIFKAGKKIGGATYLGRKDNDEFEFETSYNASIYDT